MEIDEIRKLIELFYDGKSSPAEEKRLLSLLDEADDAALPSDLVEEKRILTQICRQEPPAGLEAELTALIDNLAAVDNRDSRVDDEVKMDSGSPRVLRLPVWRKIMWWSTSVAAAVVLLVMLLPMSRPDLGDRGTLLADNDTAASMVMPEISILASSLSSTEPMEVTQEVPVKEESVQEVPVPVKKGSRRNRTADRHPASTTDRKLASVTVTESPAPPSGKNREVTDQEEAKALIGRAFSRVYRNMAIAQASIANASRPVADDAKIIENIFNQEENL